MFATKPLPVTGILVIFFVKIPTLFESGALSGITPEQNWNSEVRFAWSFTSNELKLWLPTVDNLSVIGRLPQKAGDRDGEAAGLVCSTPARICIRGGKTDQVLRGDADSPK